MAIKKFIISVDERFIDALRFKLIKEQHCADDAMLFIKSTDAGIVLAAINSDLLPCDDIEEIK